MEQILSQILQADVGSRPLYLAFSGGVDSCVLFDLLKRQGVAFKALHVNHGLHPHAQQWQAFAERLCQQQNVPYQALTIAEKPQPGESIEAWARVARYQALANILPDSAVLMTAHHADDQAETFLLKSLRGAGPQGLAGMKVIQNFPIFAQKDKLLVRPLLAFPRKTLLDYAETHQLKWVEDPANQSIRFDRNFIRAQLLPLLKQRFPQCLESFSRSAQYCQEQNEVLKICMEEKLQACRGSRSSTLSLHALKRMPHILQKAVIREWVMANGFAPLPYKKMDTLLATVFSAAPDRFPAVQWEGAVIRRYRDDLYLLPAKEKAFAREAIAWQDRSQPLLLPGQLGSITPEIALRYFKPYESVHVEFKKNAEVIWVEGVGHQSFKKWCQTRGIPPWERDSVPILVSGNTRIAIYDVKSRGKANEH